MRSPPSSSALASVSTRRQILFTGLIGSSASLLFFIPDLPFGRPFYALALLSGICHLSVYFFVKKLTRPLMTVLFVFNTILLGGVVHYTGGIISPFLFIFFCILVTASAQDLYPVFNLVITLAVFLFVIAFEAAGLIPVWNISTQEIYHSDTATVLVAVTVVGFMIVSGIIYRVILTHLRAQVEREQTMKQNYLNQLSKLDASSQVGLLVNKIVHDIRGPLGAVGGFLKLFQKELTLPEETRQDCDVMLNEMDRITRLINHMIRYTKPGTSAREDICPVELLETVLSVISFHPAARGVQFRRLFVKSGLYRINANKGELQQAYFNLIKNALEALETNEGDRIIEASIQINGSQADIDIQDNGPGMPPTVVSTLLRDSITTKKEGAGLGLVIVREIIQGHGGTVAIDSIPGQGTKVRTTLPLSEGPVLTEKLSSNGGSS